MQDSDASICNRHEVTPVTPHFLHTSLHIREVPNAGRGVFTSSSIPADTPLLRAIDLATHAFSREYRREVCSYCFSYNRGKTWKLRDTTHNTGAVWCSPACEEAWRTLHSLPEVLEALAATEKLMTSAKGHKANNLDATMLEASGGRPSADAVREAWASAESFGAPILAARTDAEGKTTKPARKAMQQVLSDPPAPVTLSYSLSSVFAARDSICWKGLTQLAQSDKPYESPAALAQHTITYLQLLCILPVSLLQYCTPGILLTAVAADAHNSFGIRSLDDQGSEMFGYGVWPSASYWNHSCKPNVGKRRVGRAWEFWALRDVREGEELCITYLGGDEEVKDVQGRRKQLEETWGFTCGCGKCVGEVREGQGADGDEDGDGDEKMQS